MRVQYGQPRWLQVCVSVCPVCSRGIINREITSIAKTSENHAIARARKLTESQRGPRTHNDNGGGHPKTTTRVLSTRKSGCLHG